MRDPINQIQAARQVNCSLPQKARSSLPCVLRKIVAGAQEAFFTRRKGEDAFYSLVEQPRLALLVADCVLNKLMHHHVDFLVRVGHLEARGSKPFHFVHIVDKSK